MYTTDNSILENHINKSSTIESRALILGEWNLNIAENIEKIGNYRFRPSLDSKTEKNWGIIAPKYDPADDNKAYTGATDSDIILDGGTDIEDNPVLFSSQETKKKLLFSLEQCFYRFRPRSGINKLIFPSNPASYKMFVPPTPDLTPGSNFNTTPRYYLATQDDYFKYWTSIRHDVVDGNVTSKIVGESYTKNYINYIDDAAPFVVYKNAIPANRIITKIQTHIDTASGLPGMFPPIPTTFAIQYLDNDNNWVDAESWTNADQSFSADGYLELQYGLMLKDDNGYNLIYSNFIDVGVIHSTDSLPSDAPDGYAYLLIENKDEKGTYYIRNSQQSTPSAYPGWDIVTPQYGWYQANEAINSSTSMVNDLVNPNYFKDGSNKVYREFSYIKGIRLKVEQMGQPGKRLDLIEISPRLAADLSGITTSYSINKVSSSISSSPFPIGSLEASTGSLSLFDYQMAFSNTNKNSILNVTKDVKVDGKIVDKEIIYNISSKNLQVKFFEVIENVGDNSQEYYVPIKTLYSDGFPQTNARERTTTIELRDLFFLLESVSPHDSLMVNQPLSFIIATMLDSAGFSNYKFYREANEKDDIIPYFFISKDSKVSQVLNELAIATQSSMFFDEFNNLIIASRGYMFPTVKDSRATADITLKGSVDSSRNGITRNYTNDAITVLANIKDIASKEEKVYNDMSIKYSDKYIQKTVRSIKQAGSLDNQRNWVYKPVVLWEVSESPNLKAINGESSNSQGYALTAMPLQETLLNVAPSVSGGKVINNEMYFGDAAYFVGRYKGYFYANGEIIRYDAVEYAHSAYVNGSLVLKNSWISSAEEYNDIFARLPFNGKIYPTGKVRIYSEVYYDANGVLAGVSKHGRGQFGTTIADHYVDSETSAWKTNKKLIKMDSKTLIDGSRQLLSTVGLIDNTVAHDQNTGIYTATISKLRAVSGFFVGGDIVADSMQYLLAESATIESATTASPFTATIKDIKTTDIFFEGQEISASPIVGSFGTGKITVKKIVSQSEIQVKSDTDALTNGTVSDIISASTSGIMSGVAKVVSIDAANNKVVVTSNTLIQAGAISYIYTDGLIIPPGGYVETGNSAKDAYKATVDNQIKEYLFVDSKTENTNSSSKPPTLSQSSALVMSGQAFNPEDNPLDYVTLINKSISSDFKYFGTRCRIIGQSIANSDKEQNPIGASGWKTIDGKTISGASGGLAIMADIDKNLGYYFEIAALTDNSVTGYTGENNNLNNVFFYKLRAKYDYVLSDNLQNIQLSENGTVLSPEDNKLTTDIDEGNQILSIEKAEVGNLIFMTGQTTKPELNGTIWKIVSLGVANVSPWKLQKVENVAYPEMLWSGLTSIITDSGQFSGIGRITGEDNPSVYDLGIEYSASSNSTTFNLYINDIRIATVVDTEAVSLTKGGDTNICLFSRGSAKLMFENVYALRKNYGDNVNASLGTPVSKVFDNDQSLSANNAFRKYALSGIVQSSFLSSIGTGNDKNQFDIYYDEFGTIMRECAYFNIRYEEAYPAFRAMIAPTLNKEKGYTISGFSGSPYGAEFLIFNNTDTILALDESSGNFLRILGITLTNESNGELSLDDYFYEKGNLSNVDIASSENLYANHVTFQNIKNSRMTYGSEKYTLDSPYIQSRGSAENILKWAIVHANPVKPKKKLGISIFANPLIQIGDIVSIDYKDRDGMDVLGTTNLRFVVSSIDYQRDNKGPSMTLNLSEVL